MEVKPNMKRLKRMNRNTNAENVELKMCQALYIQQILQFQNSINYPLKIVEIRETAVRTS